MSRADDVGSVLRSLPPEIEEIVVIGRPREVPGWQEQSGGIHLGRGVWTLRYRRITTTAGVPRP